jgi:pimeloyl-ACP methyl ester carboxylesterase
MAPSEVALEVAPYLVPLPITRELALEHIAEGAGEVGRAELAGVPGALEQMAEALALGVSGGMSGVEIDLEQQFGPGLAVADITTPVHLVHGELDTTSPPEVGVWLADRLPIATLQIVPGAGHHLLFPLWDDLMRSFNDDPAR